MDILVALQPRCVIVDRNAGGGHMNWNTSGTYIMWVPTRSYLDTAGVQFEGDWPSSRSEMSRLADDFLKRQAVSLIRFGDDDHRRVRKDKPYSLERLKQCVTDVLPKDPATPQE